MRCIPGGWLVLLLCCSVLMRSRMFLAACSQGDGLSVHRLSRWAHQAPSTVLLAAEKLCGTAERMHLLWPHFELCRP